MDLLTFCLGAGVIALLTGALGRSTAAAMVLACAMYSLWCWVDYLLGRVG